MTALTKDVQRPVKIPAGGLSTASLPLVGYTNYSGGSADNQIYKGSLVASDVSDADGYYNACGSIGNSAGGDVFGGVALHSALADSSFTADGSINVTVATTGVYGFAIGSLAVTDIGAPAYAPDDNLVNVTATSDAQWVGTVVEVDSTYIWVDISHATGRVNSAT